MMNVSRDLTPKTEDPDGKIRANNEAHDMLWVRDTITNNYDSYFTKNFFQTHNTYNDKILATYPELEQFRPAKRVGPECVWCKRGGKHKTVYTSHWMFDKKNNIVCPKLLKEQCRNCGERGHVMGKHCKQQPKAKRDLLPPRKPRMFNYRDTSDYESGDSEDYAKFRLSDATEDDCSSLSDSNSDAESYEEIEEKYVKSLMMGGRQYEYEQHCEHLEMGLADCTRQQFERDLLKKEQEPRLKCNDPRVIHVIEQVESIIKTKIVNQEKKAPPKKTWASIVASK